VRAKADSKPILFYLCAKNPKDGVYESFEKAKPKLWVRFRIRDRKGVYQEGCVSYDAFPTILKQLGAAPTMDVFRDYRQNHRRVEFFSSVFNDTWIAAEIEKGVDTFVEFHKTCLEGLNGYTEDCYLKNLHGLTYVKSDPWVPGSRNGRDRLRNPNDIRRRLITALPHGPRVAPQLVLSAPQPEPSISLADVGALLTGAILGGFLVRYCYRRFMAPEPIREASAPDSQESNTLPEPSVREA